MRSEHLHHNADEAQAWGFIFLTLLAASLFIAALAQASGIVDCQIIYSSTAAVSAGLSLYYFRQCGKLRGRAHRRAELERRQQIRTARSN